MTIKQGMPASNDIVDLSTQALVNMPYDHHEVHDGDSYDAYVYDADLDGAEIISISFTTPNTTSYLHMVSSAQNSSTSLFEIGEGATVTAGSGTDRACYNRRRTSSNTSGIKSLAETPAVSKYTYNGTITNMGTTLYQAVVGTGRFGGGTATRGTAELILKPNTVYSFRLTGIADNGVASIDLTWYEHEDRVTPDGD